SLSVVVARTATRSGSTPSASASRARIASRCGASRGSSPISTTSAFASRQPAAWTCCQARRSSSTESAPFSAGSSEEKSAPMSSSPAAPSTASIRAWAITSPSEWPARPRGESIRTPPSTSGTPSSSACASTPMPTRYSGIRERLRQLAQRVDAQRARRRLAQEAPRAATYVDGDHPCGERGLDVVVDAIADVRELRRLASGLVGYAREELPRGLLDAPPLRGPGPVDMTAQDVLVFSAHVADRAERESAPAELPQARDRIGIEAFRSKAADIGTLYAEQLPDADVGRA